MRAEPRRGVPGADVVDGDVGEAERRQHQPLPEVAAAGEAPALFPLHVDSRWPSCSFLLAGVGGSRRAAEMEGGGAVRRVRVFRARRQAGPQIGLCCDLFISLTFSTSWSWASTNGHVAQLANWAICIGRDF